MENKLDYKTFSVLVGVLKEYSKMLTKVENALGGIILENFWQVVNPIYDELERLSGVKWTDELWEILFDDSKSIGDAWEALQLLWEDTIHG